MNQKQKLERSRLKPQNIVHIFEDKLPDGTYSGKILQLEEFGGDYDRYLRFRVSVHDTEDDRNVPYDMVLKMEAYSGCKLWEIIQLFDAYNSETGEILAERLLQRSCECKIVTSKKNKQYISEISPMELENADKDENIKAINATNHKSPSSMPPKRQSFKKLLDTSSDDSGDEPNFDD